MGENIMKYVFPFFIGSLCGSVNGFARAYDTQALSDAETLTDEFSR